MYNYVIINLRVLYQIYNDVTVGPMAVRLSDYKSVITQVVKF